MPWLWVLKIAGLSNLPTCSTPKIPQQVITPITNPVGLTATSTSDFLTTPCHRRLEPWVAHWQPLRLNRQHRLLAVHRHTAPQVVTAHPAAVTHPVAAHPVVAAVVVAVAAGDSEPASDCCLVLLVLITKQLRQSLLFGFYLKVIEVPHKQRNEHDGHRI